MFQIQYYYERSKMWRVYDTVDNEEDILPTMLEATTYWDCSVRWAKQGDTNWIP